MNIRQTITSTVVALTMVAMIAPAAAGALTTADLQAQINALMAQLSSLQGSTSTVSVPAACVGVTFSRNLKVGSTGQDVKCFQVLLNTHGYVLASSGAGSPGNETMYFGPRTLTSVRAWQVAQGWTPANQVGPLSRAKFNEWLVGGTTTPTTPPVVTPSAGGLTVMLASDSPVMGNVPNGGNANFTKVTVMAGNGDVSINKMYVTRTGLSSNSAISNIKIVDATTGVYYGSIGSLNTDNKALITFTQNVVVKANTSWSFYIRATVATTGSGNAPAGNTIGLGVASASDIGSNAASVTGNFPAMGSMMTVVNVTLGTLTADEDGTTVDSQPNVGDKQVILNNFKLTAGSAEDVTVDTITMLKAGSVSNSYLSNLTLWDVTAGQSLGTVASLNAEGKASWTGLAKVITKGNTNRYRILGDIVDGPGLTANADVIDGSDVLVTAKGNTYGFYIAPTVGTWNGSNNGQGANNQTVKSGALVVSKATSTPATGYISAGDNQTLAVIDLNANGEAMKISSFKLTAVLGTMTYGEVTSVKVYDENGVIVAGPKDLASDSTVTLTDTFIVPVGVHHYTVKAKIASTVSSSDTIYIGVSNSGTHITAVGMTSNNSITPTPATAINGNVQTIKAAALSMTTLADPAAKSIAVGTSNVVWATASLSAANSGEDVQVSTITVRDENSATGDLDDISNMALYADLTSANSDRGDVFETRISDFKNPSGNTTGADGNQAFTLSQTIVVPKGGFIKVALVGNLSSGASTSSDTHTFFFADAASGSTPFGLTATGASTGSSATVTESHTSYQTMTVSSGGSLTLTKDSSSPVADLVLGGTTVNLGVFRLAANNVEDLNVQDITLSVTGGNAVQTFYFYNGSTLLGSVAGGTAPKLVLSNNQLVVPANHYTLVTVKGLILPVDGSVLINGTTLTATIQGSAKVNTIGVGSGTSVTSGVQAAIGNTMIIQKAKPVITLAANSPSGTLIPSTSHLLAIFDVTAQGQDDVTFSSSQTNLFTVSISKSRNTSDGTAGNWVLKDQDGTTLSTISVADSATSVTFLFASNTFSVAPNTTKKLYVYGDTHEYTNGTTHDSIQLSLQDNSDSNLSYSVNAGATQATGTKVFKGGIYAGSFVK